MLHDNPFDYIQENEWIKLDKIIINWFIIKNNIISIIIKIINYY